MSETEEIRRILGQVLQHLGLLTDEVSELVDRLYRPLTSVEAMHMIPERVDALQAAFDALRKDAETSLGTTFPDTDRGSL